MGAWRRFTFEERKAIEEMLKGGHTYAHIGNCLKRNSSAIHAEINRHGGPEVYSANEAELQKKGPYLSKIYGEFSDRIDNIEQQIEILFGQMKNLLDEEN